MNSVMVLKMENK